MIKEKLMTKKKKKYLIEYLKEVEKREQIQW